MKTETRINIDETHYMRVIVDSEANEDDAISSTVFYSIEDEISFITRVVNVYVDGKINTLEYKSVGYGREKILDCIVERSDTNKVKWVPEEDWGHAFTDDSDIVGLYASGTNYKYHFCWFCK
mgnify:CR=1 FL=1